MRTPKLTGIIFFTAALAWAGLTKAAELPLSLTQNEWATAKRQVTLPTGITMKYVEMGQPNGEVIIFLHNLADSSRTWSLIAPFLSEKYHIFLVDLRGHGGTDKPDLRMYPLSMYASDVAEFMDALGLERAHLAGHSLGSFIAQVFAANYPEKTGKLILVSSTMVKFDNLGRNLYDTAITFGDNKPESAFMAEWFATQSPVDKEFFKKEMADAQNVPSYVWRAATKGAAFSELTPFMEEVNAPALILWGTADGFFDLDNQNALKRALPQAKFLAYEKVGHNVHWEIPEKMAADIIYFLTEK